MLGRPHAERLRYDLDEIRTELVAVVKGFLPEELNWAPRPDMKSCKQLLLEIGTMEELSRRWVTHRELPDWGTTWNSLDGADADAVLAALDGVRAETLNYLRGCTEEQLQTPIPVPESWQQFFPGVPDIEPEELFRWIVRHEYYHLGQLVTYSFECGHKP